MIGKPKVGDVVCLNDEGIEVMGGLKSREQVAAAARMTIVEVDPTDMCPPEGVYAIEVSGPLAYLFFSNRDVDLL